jgi:Transposase DDE domain
MEDRTRNWHSLQVGWLRRQFAQGSGLPFSEILSAELVQQVLDEVGGFFRERIFTPLTTLWVLLSQVTSADGSCRDAVWRLLAFLASRNETPCAPGTGSYCKARQRLPEKILSRLTQETAAKMTQEVPPDWRWKGREVKVVDGTTLSMPDTRANQKAYPQSSTQKPGLGFPLVRLVCLFSLATGAVLDAALGPCRGKGKGELSLFRKLWSRLHGGDVLLGDRHYCAYFDIAHWLGLGVDFVGRLHQARSADLRRGKRWGRGDRLVEWSRPKQRPRWLSQRAFRRMPETLTLRLIRVCVDQPGFRTQQITVVATLLDGELYPAADIAALYRARWHAELDLRSLKVTLAMDVLRGKTPPIVRKEIWAHLLAYNLIRAVIAQTAVEHGVLPRSLSFKAALQTLHAFGMFLCLCGPSRLHDLYPTMLAVIASQHVGDRPDRFEPRARKRRPKPYPYLTTPRREYKAALLQTTSA